MPASSCAPSLSSSIPARRPTAPPLPQSRAAYPSPAFLRGGEMISFASTQWKSMQETVKHLNGIVSQHDSEHGLAQRADGEEPVFEGMFADELDMSARRLRPP
eukprot:scaffold7569_cov27-Tisochrysis_lutea.AAC.6